MSDSEIFDRWLRLGAEFAREMTEKRLAAIHSARLKLVERIAGLNHEETQLKQLLERLGGTNGRSVDSGG